MVFLCFFLEIQGFSIEFSIEFDVNLWSYAVIRCLRGA